MKSSSQSPRTPSSLSDSVHHHLGLYALAASAAGVGVIALSPSAEAKIIYTKTNLDVFEVYPGFPLDLNNDGKADFRFVGFSCSYTEGGLGIAPASRLVLSSMRIAPASPRNAIWWDVKGNGAAALRAGVRVGPKAPFAGELLMGSVSLGLSVSGPWENGGRGVTNRYLGLEFAIKGKSHYGWARLNFPNPAGATLTGYAYETVANKAIIAGKTKGPDVVTLDPGSLGQLAQGSAGCLKK